LDFPEEDLFLSVQILGHDVFIREKEADIDIFIEKLVRPFEGVSHHFPKKACSSKEALHIDPCFGDFCSSAFLPERSGLSLALIFRSQECLWRNLQYTFNPEQLPKMG